MTQEEIKQHASVAVSKAAKALTQRYDTTDIVTHVELATMGLTGVNDYALLAVELERMGYDMYPLNVDSFQICELF
jgi:hypothetical protein